MFHLPTWCGWIKLTDMGNNKQQLLQKQVKILDNVIEVLQKNFIVEEIEDEINFLSIVSSNLKGLVNN